MSPGALILGNRVQDGGNSSVAEFQRAGGHLRVHGSGGMLRLANYPFQSKTGAKPGTMAQDSEQRSIDGIQEDIMADDQAERYVHEWLHPRVVVEGADLAHEAMNKFLDEAFVAFKKAEADSEKKLDAAADKSDEVVVVVARRTPASSRRDEDECVALWNFRLRLPWTSWMKRGL